MIDGQEFEYLVDCLNRKESIIKMSKDPTWLIAFAEYNTMNKDRLSVTCAPCYVKVMLWHKQRRDQDRIDWINRFKK